MKRFASLLLVGALAAMAGLVTLPSESQGEIGGEGLPPGIISKNPVESELSISVWMEQGVYVEGAIAANFIRFTINQAAFIYLYDIAPDGEVRLLFPNRSVPRNFLTAGEYAFPEDFMPGFPIEKSGVHFVQAIATEQAIDLIPGSELFRLLGRDPETVKEGVLLLIKARGLEINQWAADWTRYQAATTVPTSPDEGSVLVKVLDFQGEVVPNAQVCILRIEDAQRIPTDFCRDPEDTTTWTFVGRGKEFKLKVGKYAFLARARFFVPDPQVACTVSPREIPPQELDVCEFELYSTDRRLPVTFTLRLPGPEDERRAGFTSKPVSAAFHPSCPNELVLFDASPSGPKEEIQQFIWDFGDGTTRSLPSDELTITHRYLSEGTYTATLTVIFKDSKALVFRDRVEVRTQKRCIPTDPQTRVIKLSKAEVDVRGSGESAIITTTILSGFVAALVPDLELPAQAEVVKLRFTAGFDSFPIIAVRRGEAFISAKVVALFIDGEGSIVDSYALPVLEVGERPPLGQPQEYISPQPIPIPQSVPREELSLRVWAITSLQALFTPEEPLIVVYSGFRIEGVEPGPDCARLETGVLADGQFFPWQMFNQVREPTGGVTAQTVAFRLSNVSCGGAVRLESWTILDNSGQTVFGPKVVATLVTQGDSITWTWDQRANPPPGTAQGPLVVPEAIYRVEAVVIVQEKETLYNVPFGIAFRF